MALKSHLFTMLNHFQGARLPSFASKAFYGREKLLERSFHSGPAFLINYNAIILPHRTQQFEDGLSPIFDSVIHTGDDDSRQATTSPFYHFYSEFYDFITSIKI